jgi:NADH-quinone oxidoreductase subunit I/electron transport complex protein RnfC
VQYPEEREQLPEAYRNFPVLLYEDASGQELCTSCFQCERICPPQVIHITQAKDPATGKAIPAIEEFLLEYDACMSCGLCAEVCPFDAIKMDHEFELSTDTHGGLTLDRAGLARPISYYARLAPTMWAEVRDEALKKLQGSVKRRTGLIGIAPPMRDVMRREQAVERPQPAEAAPTAEVMDPAAAKAAKLAAIRAANAAKQAGSADAGAQTPPAPQDDKAAKLAAIRAANAARKAGSADAGEAGAQASPAPQDDKAARLAAIRAANAARKAQQSEETPENNGSAGQK